MNDAALAGVVVCQSVPLVCDFLAASVCGGCYGRLAFSSADDFDTAMIDSDTVSPPRYFFRLAESERLAKQGVYFWEVHKGVDSVCCRRGSVASPVAA